MKSRQKNSELKTGSVSSLENTTAYSPVTASKKLTTTIVTNIEGFSDLQDRWDELLLSSNTESCFLSWEWLYTWAEIYGGSDTELLIIVTKKNNEIVGIAPFCIKQEKRKRSPDKKILRFIGTGEPEEDEICSYFLDIIAREGYERVVAEVVLDEVSKISKHWDEAVFPDLLEQSVMYQFVWPLLENKGYSSLLENDGIRFCIDTPESMKDYLSSLSKKRRKNIRLNTNRFEKEGNLKEYSAKTLEEALDAFEKLKKLHEVRWQQQGEKGAFASSLFTAFHRSIIQRLMEKGWLELRILMLDEKPISALYNIKYKSTVFSYQSGFSYSKYSPGLHHDLIAIEDCIQSNCSDYDYLKGQKDSYKASLNARESQMFILSIFKSRKIYIYKLLKRKVYQVVEKARNVLRG